MKRTSLPGLMHHHSCSRAEGICSYWVLILQIQLCNLHILFRLHQKCPTFAGCSCGSAVTPKKGWHSANGHICMEDQAEVIFASPKPVTHLLKRGSTSSSCRKLSWTSGGVDERVKKVLSWESTKYKRKCIRNQALEPLHVIHVLLVTVVAEEDVMMPMEKTLHAF